jgi:hypothetical protein
MYNGETSEGREKYWENALRLNVASHSGSLFSSIMDSMYLFAIEDKLINVQALLDRTPRNIKYS